MCAAERIALPGGQGGKVATKHTDTSLSGPQDPSQQLEKCRFSAAAWPIEENPLAALDDQRRDVQNIRPIRVPKAYLVELDSTGQLCMADPGSPAPSVTFIAGPPAHPCPA